MSYLTLNAKSVKAEAETKRDSAEKTENTSSSDEPKQEKQSSEKKLLNDKKVDELYKRIGSTIRELDEQLRDALGD